MESVGALISENFVVQPGAGPAFVQLAAQFGEEQAQNATHRVWTFADDAEFELHEDGCFIRTTEHALAVPYSSIAFLVTE
jgi:hypothetical protein